MGGVGQVGTSMAQAAAPAFAPPAAPPAKPWPQHSALATAAAAAAQPWQQRLALTQISKVMWLSILTCSGGGGIALQALAVDDVMGEQQQAQQQQRVAGRNS